MRGGCGIYSNQTRFTRRAFRYILTARERYDIVAPIHIRRLLPQPLVLAKLLFVLGPRTARAAARIRPSRSRRKKRDVRDPLEPGIRARVRSY